MIRQFNIIILLSMLNLMIVGCVPNNNINHIIIDAQRIAKVRKLHDWELYGKISYYDQKNKQAVICYITWNKNHNKSYITLSSVMNIKIATLAIENGKIIILDSSNILTKDLENIINNISLNINNLNYWILGAPNPQYKYNLINGGFKQQGWDIKYAGNIIYNSIDIPKVIIMLHKKLQICMKIIISIKS